MMPIDLEKAFGLITPIPYVVITILDAKGKPNAMGVSWVTRTSFDPPLMLVSIDNSRYSREGLEGHKEYVINYLTPEQTRGAWICGSESGRNEDKLKLAGLALIPSSTIKTPTIKDAQVALECRVIDMHETGDHTIYVAEVLAATTNPQKTKHLYYTSDNRLIGMDEKGDR